MTKLRAALHEIRCAECRVSWFSWAQRIVGIQAGFSPNIQRAAARRQAKKGRGSRDRS